MTTLSPIHPPPPIMVYSLDILLWRFVVPHPLLVKSIMYGIILLMLGFHCSSVAYSNSVFHSMHDRKERLFTLEKKFLDLGE